MTNLLGDDQCLRGGTRLVIEAGKHTFTGDVIIPRCSFGVGFGKYIRIRETCKPPHRDVEFSQFDRNLSNRHNASALTMNYTTLVEQGYAKHNTTIF